MSEVVEKRALRPHQVEAVRNLKNGSILVGGVGVGKSTTALAYYVQKVCGGRIDRSAPMSTPKKLVIITPAKKRNDLDWEEEALHYGIFKDSEVSYGHQEFIVDSWNNIQKYKNVRDAFFIFDEQKVVGKGAWAKTFIELAGKNEWILLSATPADNWLDYVPVFLAHGFYRNRNHFWDEHVIWKLVNGKYPQVRGYYGQRYLEGLRDSLLVEMPYERHTVRHVEETFVEHDTNLFGLVWRKLWHVYEDRPLEDSGEKHRIGRKVVNSDPSRLDKICELSEKHPRLIIFYSFNYELDLLRTLSERLGIPVAEYNGHKHEPIPETDRWLYLVQYTSGAEAWNCITTDAMVLYSLQYSHKVHEQVLGRIDRMNTPFVDLWYYILMSKTAVDKSIWRSLMGKKDFHEGPNVKYRGRE